MRRLFEEKVAAILKEIVDLPTKKVVIHSNFLVSVHLVKIGANDMHKIKSLTVSKLSQFLQLVNV